MIGIVLLAANTGLDRFVMSQGARQAERAFQSGDMGDALLPRMLQAVVAQTVLPQTVDDITTLVRLELDGPTLRYIYQVQAGADVVFTDALVDSLIAQNCKLAQVRPLVQSGATLEHSYIWQDGTELGMFVVTPADCGL